MKVHWERYLRHGDHELEFWDLEGVGAVEAAIRALPEGDATLDGYLRFRVGRWDLSVHASGSVFGVELRLATEALGDNLMRYGHTARLYQMLDPASGPGETAAHSGGLETEVPYQYVVTADDAVAVARELLATGSVAFVADRWEVDVLEDE